jgi:hypothetical protein
MAKTAQTAQSFTSARRKHLKHAAYVTAKMTRPDEGRGGRSDDGHVIKDRGDHRPEVDCGETIHRTRMERIPRFDLDNGTTRREVEIDDDIDIDDDIP